MIIGVVSRVGSTLVIGKLIIERSYSLLVIVLLLYKINRRNRFSVKFITHHLFLSTKIIFKVLMITLLID